MTVTEKVAYLKGLAEGLGIEEDSKEGKLLKAVMDVLADLAVSVEDLEDYPRYAFEQGANNSFFFSEEPLAELPHKKCISVRDRGTLSNLLAHHNGYTISTGVLSSEMYTGIASVPLQTKELMRVGYIVHNERQLSDLAQSYIEKLSLFVEGYQIGLAGL